MVKATRSRLFWVKFDQLSNKTSGDFKRNCKKISGKFECKIKEILKVFENFLTEFRIKYEQIFVKTFFWNLDTFEVILKFKDAEVELLSKGKRKELLRQIWKC